MLLSFIHFSSMKRSLTLSDVKALLVIVTGLLILFFIFELEAFLYAAATIGVISLMIPKIGLGIVWVWFKIAEVLGWINSKIILSVLFYLFLFPISMIYRLFNKDPMELKPQKESMFAERNHTYKPEDLDNMW